MLPRDKARAEGNGIKRRSKAAGKAVIRRRLQLRSRSNAAIIMAAAVAP